MAFRKKSGRSFRRRRPTTFKRKRFAKKSFSRSTAGFTKVKGTLIGKNAMVKVDYRKDWDCGVTGSTDTWGVPNTYGLTFPITARPASLFFLGSHCCTSLGTSDNGIADIIEKFPSGLDRWQSFYQKGLCMGSSIRVDIMPLANATETAARWVLLPIACLAYEDITTPNGTTTADATANQTKGTLDALDYPDLCAYPGAQYGYVRTANSGVTRFKGFRKTKNMLGFKDVKDNQQSLEMLLPNSAGTVGRNTGSAVADVDEAQGWGWYLRIFGAGSSNPGNLQFLVRQKFYLMLTDRQSYNQVTAAD